MSPSFANYTFSPVSRSFTLNSNRTDATFVAEPNLIITTNPIDGAEYFVRQQYLDFLGRARANPGLILCRLVKRLTGRAVVLPLTSAKE